MEVQVIKQFKEKFIRRKDIGSEYFEGNYKSMIDIIYSTVKSEEENVENIVTSVVEVDVSKPKNKICRYCDTTESFATYNLRFLHREKCKIEFFENYGGSFKFKYLLGLIPSVQYISVVQFVILCTALCIG